MSRRILIAGLLLAACRGRHAPPKAVLASLVQAAAEGNAARVGLLLESDPGLARASFEGAASGPVGVAAREGHAAVIRLLIQAGADPRERDNLGLTPLHAAQDVEVAALLLELGVSADVRSSSGETPLMTRVGEPLVVERLLQAGAHGDLRDIDGRTAIHHAVLRVGASPLASIVTLCAFGADPRVLDEKGETALDLVRGSGAGNAQSAVSAALLARGGPCEALRARSGGPRPTPAERAAILADVTANAGNHVP